MYLLIYIYLSVYLTIYMSIYLSLSIYLPICFYVKQVREENCWALEMTACVVNTTASKSAWTLSVVIGAPAIADINWIPTVKRAVVSIQGHILAILF